tara:strand:- start:553 stop:1044 length:492 start_codon:yes stop_codon:yes gene_type:complete
MLAEKSLKILIVCLGNICRSPTAHGVLSKMIISKNLEGAIEIDSAGTGSWHLGQNPDFRSTRAASSRGYDISKLTARQITDTDFSEFDYLLAMDKSNLSDLNKLCPERYKHKLELFLRFGSTGELSVPDPYYDESSGFEVVFDLIEDACEKFLEYVIEKHKLG